MSDATRTTGLILPFKEGRLSDEPSDSPLPELRPTSAPFGGNTNPQLPTIRISAGDVEVNIGVPAIQGTRTQDESPEFGRNLAEDLDESTLGKLADEVVQGVESDITSRQKWITQYARGLDLLGTDIEEPQEGQQKGVSRIGHPLMIEAMVRYEAAAEAELLPASGPCKVPTIGRASPDEEREAQDFQDDFNYILTEEMTEFYPDTGSMLMHQAYCGLGYKKVFWDPLLNRPTSQSVLAPNLIVSEEATDLQTASRVTHEIEMTRSMLRRMQILGHYIDIEIGMPTAGVGLGRQAQLKLSEIQGLTPVAIRPQDQPYLIWETDEDFIPGMGGLPEGRFERKARGMPLPYKIAVEKSSMKVLGVWRNWRPDDPLFRKRNMYVKYTMIPSLGYHPWGFRHLLGNSTMALRGVWRLLLDAGLFSNFPGGVKDGRFRSSTNQIRPSPGEWVDIDGPGIGPDFDIRKHFMAMPYNVQAAAPLFQLSEAIKQDAMRLGATTQIEVGEGRTNVPVGTIMAMVEQQIQVMAGVHKRNHRAQKEELRLIRELFATDIDALNRFAKLRPRPGDTEPRIWKAAHEFMDLNLQPASDPNVPADIMRKQQVNLLVMLAQQFPALFDLPEIAKYTITTIGADPERFLVQPGQNQAPPPPDPKVIAATIKAQSDQQKQQTDAATAAARIQLEREHLAVEAGKAAADNQTDIATTQMKTAQSHAQPYHDAAAQGLANPPHLVGFGE